MTDRAFEVGSIETPDGPLSVGVDCGAVGVYVGGWLIEGVTLTAAQAEEFAQLFVSAVWQAGQSKARMDREAAPEVPKVTVGLACNHEAEVPEDEADCVLGYCPACQRLRPITKDAAEATHG